MYDYYYSNNALCLIYSENIRISNSDLNNNLRVYPTHQRALNMINAVEPVTTAARKQYTVILLYCFIINKIICYLIEETEFPGKNKIFFIFHFSL